MAATIKGAWLVDAECPVCRKRYGFEELFVPKAFFKGDREETYECEECKTLLKIEVQMNLRATPMDILSEDQTEIVLDEDLPEPTLDLSEE